MAKLSILAGATSQSVNLFIQDSTSTTGAGKTGLAFNTSGLIAYYTFAGANATATAITLATLAAVNSAYSSGGFKEIDSVHMPGVYRLDIPNTALAAASGRSVLLMLSGATGMAPCVLEIELTGWDNQDAVHGGMSALPNTACTTNASLITSGTGTDQLQVASGIASADAKKINAVSTSSVTTINANQGTTQPTNFTGTGVSALVKSDAVDIAGSAVATGSAQIGVNVVNIAGAAVNTAAAQLGVNVVNIAGAAAALDVNNLLKVDVADWNAVAVGALPSNFSTLSIDASGRVTIAPQQIVAKKNAAFNLFFVMTDSTNHNPSAGLTVSGQRSIDGGALGAVTGTITGIGSGLYMLAASAADMNGNSIAFVFTATASDTTFMSVSTQP